MAFPLQPVVGMKRPTVFSFLLMLVVMGVALALALRSNVVSSTSSNTVPFTQLKQALERGEVEALRIEPERLVATLKTPAGGRRQELLAERLPNIDDKELLAVAAEKEVVVTGHFDERGGLWWAALWGLSPLLLLYFLVRGMGASAALNRKGAKPLSFGKSQAKIFDRSTDNAITFNDVAGVDDARSELEEVVRFLRTPDKYQALGARVPKGVLLIGPPGTGKTLLARAVAGESGVPFFSLSGSEFVEMFVGVGASRVRDLFEQAKQRAPCIVFIDELDAVGKTRAGAAGFAANEEREQTLNQLLVEMDGFDSGTGLVLMAATNRPEVLDKALLRAGRFDRTVLVDRPDVRGREAILKVHMRKLKLGPDVDVHVFAQRTPGMVGADLANTVNEAALATARREGTQVEARDFEEAIDRIQLGLRKDGRVMSEAERRRVACHEGGHALVALTLPHADPVHRVTILPRSIGALGATLQLPTEDRYLMTRDELVDALCVMLGGRVAEALVMGDASTGAQNDLERASELARQMVCRFGMSSLGPQTFGRPMGNPSAIGAVVFDERNFSERTARQIDAEVAALLEREEARARSVLSQRRSTLDAISKALLERETLERDELTAVMKDAAPFAPVPSAA